MTENSRAANPDFLRAAPCTPWFKVYAIAEIDDFTGLHQPRDRSGSYAMCGLLVAVRGQALEHLDHCESIGEIPLAARIREDVGLRRMAGALGELVMIAHVVEMRAARDRARHAFVASDGAAT